MRDRQRRRHAVLRGCAVGLLATTYGAYGFVPVGTDADDSRWSTTANGGTGSAGDPITLTWSIVPDGTLVSNAELTSFSASDFVADFDAAFGSGPGGSDLTLRPWFTFFEQSFDRLGEVSGVTYVYEPNDDGVTHGQFDGALGQRGDIRIGGIGLDGVGGTLAYNFFPFSGGDMALDTDDLVADFADASNGYRYLRNTIMHEAGHGLGLNHSSSSDSDFLLESTVNTTFDGPQHDDLRGFHWLYGDVLEKASAGRNETAATASPLGALLEGQPLTIGAGGSGTVVGPSETDFVSITNENDDDVFAFTVGASGWVDVTMTPRGASFDQGGVSFVTTQTSDLSLDLLDADGVTLLDTSASAGAGGNESITDVFISTPGEYYARVRSATAAVGQVTQLYQLDLSFIEVLTGDYNADGFVSQADLDLVLLNWGDASVPVEWLAADQFDGVQVSQNELDGVLLNWGNGTPPAVAIPEPATAFWTVVALGGLGRRTRRSAIAR